MYVILHASNAITFASCISDYGCEVCVNRLANRFGEIGASVLGAKYQMYDDDT